MGLKVRNGATRSSVRLKGQASHLAYLQQKLRSWLGRWPRRQSPMFEGGVVRGNVVSAHSPLLNSARILHSCLKWCENEKFMSSLYRLLPLSRIRRFLFSRLFGSARCFYCCDAWCLHMQGVHI